MDVLLADDFWATPWRFVWHAGSRTAICADWHLGLEVQLAEQGLYLPDISAAGLERAWGAVLERRARRVVIAGDLFDSAEPGEQVIDMARGMLGKVADGCEVVMVRGNHDPEVGRLGEMLGGSVRVVGSQGVEVGGYAVVHGDVGGVGGFGLVGDLGGRSGGTVEGSRRDACTTIDACRTIKGGVTGVIVGHQHPAVMVRSGVRAEKMICFAVSRMVAGRTMLMLPAFSRGPLGSDLGVQRNWILPVRYPGRGGIRVVGLIEATGREPEVLDFGKLEELNG